VELLVVVASSCAPTVAKKETTFSSFLSPRIGTELGLGWFWRWTGLSIGLLVGYCGQVSPGEPPLHFFSVFFFFLIFCF
jgi:hypothetical protein